MVQIIRNPCLPFTTPIPRGFHPGRSAVIRGTPFSGSEQRFSIDLMTSSGSLPLHFNPRFGFGGCWQTVLNSSPRSGQWANEERHANMVQIGVPFELQICAEHDKYVLTINGNFFCNFRHRETPYNVNAIRIAGDVTIEYIKFPDFATYPNFGAFGAQSMFPGMSMPMRTPMPAPMPMPMPYPNCPGGMNGSSHSYQEFNNPAVPFSSTVYGGFNGPRRITIVGTPLSCVDQFSINLKSGSEFLFHFNPRFRGCPVVVRNSTRCGSWLTEERSASCFPFVPNGTFSMEICATGSCYTVTVNGQHFTTFTARDDPCRVDQLTIVGDICVQKVIIQ